MTRLEALSQIADSLCPIYLRLEQAQKIAERLDRLAVNSPGNQDAVDLAAMVRVRVGWIFGAREHRAHRRGRADTGVRKLQSEVSL